MSTLHAVDYSWSHPAPDRLKAAGVRLVVRYTTGTKALSAEEAVALRARDIGIALVFETSIFRANTAGAAGGAQDMSQVNGFAPTVGYPGDGTVFFACDTAPNLAGCRAYFQGIRPLRGAHPIGWYGGMQVGLQLKAEGLVDVVWVANAASWSGFGRWSDLAPVARANPEVSMLQSLDHPLDLDGSYDYNELLRLFPAWGIAITPPAPPVPPTPPTSTTTDLGDVPLKHTVIRPVRLDEHGNGYIIAPPKTVSVVIQAGPKPTPATGYLKRPTASLTADGRYIVLLGGAPSSDIIVNAYSL